MAANECIPFYEPGTRIPAHATASVTGKRLVKVSGNMQSDPFGLNTLTDGGNMKVAHADAGGRAIGVSSHDIASAAKGTVIREGVVPITAEGAIAAFAEVQVGTAGKAVTKTTGVAVGVCIHGVDDGEDAPIALYESPNSGSPGSGNLYAQGTPQADIVALTDSTGGTANNTVAAMPVLTDSPATADALRDDIVTNLVPVVNSNFADLTAKVNAILAVLDEYGMTL